MQKRGIVPPLWGFYRRVEALDIQAAEPRADSGEEQTMQKMTRRVLARRDWRSS